MKYLMTLFLVFGFNTYMEGIGSLQCSQKLFWKDLKASG